jgi:hypothetical protein
MGNYYFVGYVNKYGDFIPDLSIPPRDLGKGRPIGASASPGPLMGLSPGKKEEVVYEYRCDVLVKGMFKVLDDNYLHFVPDIESKPILFKDYKEDSGIRIYNLPDHLKKPHPLLPGGKGK